MTDENAAGYALRDVLSFQAAATKYVDGDDAMIDCKVFEYPYHPNDILTTSAHACTA